MFCPKCGSLLLPKTEGKKKVFACKCGYSTKEFKEARLQEKVKEKKGIEIIDKEVNTLPLTEAECPKCGHKKAYYWTIQTRASDEPETKFFKCEKCKNVWRDYS